MGYLARLVAYLGRLIEAAIPGGPGLPVDDESTAREGVPPEPRWRALATLLGTVTPLVVLALLVVGVPWPVLAAVAAVLLAPAALSVLLPTSR
jgi:hypothetical protein